MQLTFAWAQEQARGVTQLDERIAAANEAVARCERVLHETMGYREVEALKERLADAKREAVAGDANVADAKDALKVARSKMKDTAAGPLKAYRAAKGQGFIRNGNEFIHPGMKLAFSVPQDVKLANTSSAVVGRSQSGAQMQFSGGSSQQTPAQIIDNDISKSLGVALAPARNITVNGRQGAVGAARANTQNGPVDVQAFVIRWEGTTNYIFLWLTPANVTATMQQGINNSVSSLRTIDPSTVKVPPVQKINIAAVGARDTVSGLAAKTTFENAKEERFISEAAVARPLPIRPPKQPAGDERVGRLAGCHPQPRDHPRSREDPPLPPVRRSGQ